MPDNPPHDRNNTARRDFICLVQAEVESSATPFVISKNPVAASEKPMRRKRQCLQHFAENGKQDDIAAYFDQGFKSVNDAGHQ